LTVGVITLLAAVATASAAEVPFACTTNGGGNWAVTASAPISIVCPQTGNCPALRSGLLSGNTGFYEPCYPGGGECTAIQYSVVKLKGLYVEHVAILADHEVVVVPAHSWDLAQPCNGDPVTEIGIRDCSTQAVRLNKNSETQLFDLIVEGDASPITSSIVVKKGKVIEECRIASLGPLTVDLKAQLTTKETFQFDDCEVEIAINPFTGQPGEASVISGDCAVSAEPVQNLQLVINGQAQEVNTGDGWLSTGTDSCTTRLYRGVSYVTCNCKNATDPSPPCP
jgi:hypothetical protein